MKRGIGILLRISVLIPGSILIVIGCSPTEAPPAAPIVAMVDEEEISLKDFEAAFGELQLGGDLGQKSEELRKLKQSTLENLIQDKLLLVEASRKGIAVSEEDLQREVDRIKMGLSDEEFRLILQEQALSLEEWKAALAGDLLKQKVISLSIPQEFEISDEEVKTFYRENRDEFKEPETVRARQIVVQDEKTAHEIRRRLVEGESFEALARSLSFSPDKEKGGDLGFFSKGDMPSEFNVVFSLKLNEISPVVSTPYGSHIFRLEERRKSRLIPLEEAEGVIRKHLGALRQEKLFALWIEGLKERTRITINDSILYQSIEKSNGVLPAEEK